MTASAKEITSTRLIAGLTAPNSSDELGRLANTFNDMIARLQRSFDEIRRFTADAAHGAADTAGVDAHRCGGRRRPLAHPKTVAACS